jgi:hypothetical protein
VIAVAGADVVVELDRHLIADIDLGRLVVDDPERIGQGRRSIELVKLISTLGE